MNYRVAGLSLWLGLAPGIALAGGFETEYPDNGARALGRAGAFVARADDPSAIYYNPAGLAGQDGFELFISANLIALTATFDPADDFVLGNTARREFGTLSNEADPFIAPMIAAHFDFDALPTLDFGFGIYGPSATGHRKFPNQYPIVGAFRAADGKDISERLPGSPANALLPNGMFIEGNLLEFFTTVSVAWQPTPEWRLGLSLQNASFIAEIDQAIGGAVPAVAQLKVHDYFTPTGIIGAQYLPTSWLEFGLSVRPPIAIDGEGTGKIKRFASPCPRGPCGDDPQLEPYELAGDLPTLDDDGTPNDAITFDYNHPMVVRFGLRYVHRAGPAADGDEVFDLELDYIYQLQSVHESYLVKFAADRAVVPGEAGAEGLSVSPVPDIDDRREYQDTHGLRLGGDYYVMPGLFTVRAGGSYETGASPEKYTHIDFPGLDQYSVAVGAGLHLDLVDIDVGYSYVGTLGRDVDESDVRLIDITVARDKAAIVGNGRFDAHYHIVGLSTTWHL